MNPADIWSKHWTHNSVWHSPPLLIFGQGDTFDFDVDGQSKPGQTGKAQQAVYFAAGILTLLFLCLPIMLSQVMTGSIKTIMIPSMCM